MEYEKLKKVVRFLALEEMKDTTGMQYATLLQKHVKVVEAACCIATTSVSTANAAFLKSATLLAVALGDSQSLPADAPQHQVGFQKSLAPIREAAQKLQKDMQTQVGQAVQTSLADCCEKLKPKIEELQVWKRDLVDDASIPWQKVVASAEVLMGDTTSQLVELFKALKKEHRAECVMGPWDSLRKVEEANMRRQDAFFMLSPFQTPEGPCEPDLRPKSVSPGQASPLGPSCPRNVGVIWTFNPHMPPQTLATCGPSFKFWVQSKAVASQYAHVKGQ